MSNMIGWLVALAVVQFLPPTIAFIGEGVLRRVWEWVWDNFILGQSDELLNLILEWGGALLNRIFSILFAPVWELITYAPAPRFPGSGMRVNFWAEPTNAPWSMLYPWNHPEFLAGCYALLFTFWQVSNALTAWGIVDEEVAQKRTKGFFIGLFAIPGGYYVIALGLRFLNVINLWLKPTPMAIAETMPTRSEISVAAAVYLIGNGVFVIAAIAHMARIGLVIMIAAGWPFLAAIRFSYCPYLWKRAQTLLELLPKMAFMPLITSLFFRLMVSFMGPDGLNIPMLTDGIAGWVIRKFFYILPGFLGIAVPIVLILNTEGIPKPRSYSFGGAVRGSAVNRFKSAASTGKAAAGYGARSAYHKWGPGGGGDLSGGGGGGGSGGGGSGGSGSSGSSGGIFSKIPDGPGYKSFPSPDRSGSQNNNRDAASGESSGAGSSAESDATSGQRSRDDAQVGTDPEDVPYNESKGVTDRLREFKENFDQYRSEGENPWNTNPTGTPGEVAANVEELEGDRINMEEATWERDYVTETKNGNVVDVGRFKGKDGSEVRAAVHNPGLDGTPNLEEGATYDLEDLSVEEYSSTFNGAHDDVTGPYNRLKVEDDVEIDNKAGSGPTAWDELREETSKVRQDDKSSAGRQDPSDWPHRGEFSPGELSENREEYAGGQADIDRGIFERTAHEWDDKGKENGPLQLGYIHDPDGEGKTPVAIFNADDPDRPVPEDGDEISVSNGRYDEWYIDHPTGHHEHRVDDVDGDGTYGELKFDTQTTVTTHSSGNDIPKSSGSSRSSESSESSGSSESSKSQGSSGSSESSKSQGSSGSSESSKSQGSSGSSESSGSASDRQTVSPSEVSAEAPPSGAERVDVAEGEYVSEGEETVFGATIEKGYIKSSDGDSYVPVVRPTPESEQTPDIQDGDQVEISGAEYDSFEADTEGRHSSDEVITDESGHYAGLTIDSESQVASGGAEESSSQSTPDSSTTGRSQVSPGDLNPDDPPGEPSAIDVEEGMYTSTDDRSQTERDVERGYLHGKGDGEKVPVIRSNPDSGETPDFNSAEKVSPKNAEFREVTADTDNTHSSDEVPTDEDGHYGAVVIDETSRLGGGSGSESGSSPSSKPSPESSSSPGESAGTGRSNGSTPSEGTSSNRSSSRRAALKKFDNTVEGHSF